jgi:hypothetical protein
MAGAGNHHETEQRKVNSWRLQTRNGASMLHIRTGNSAAPKSGYQQWPAVAALKTKRVPLDLGSGMKMQSKHWREQRRNEIHQKDDALAMKSRRKSRCCSAGKNRPDRQCSQGQDRPERTNAAQAAAEKKSSASTAPGTAWPPMLRTKSTWKWPAAMACLRAGMERPGHGICGPKPAARPRREDSPTSALTSAHKRQISAGTVKTSAGDRARARTTKTAKCKREIRSWAEPRKIGHRPRANLKIWELETAKKKNKLKIAQIWRKYIISTSRRDETQLWKSEIFLHKN